MRLDKFLKVSRIIKRRTVANDACDAGRVTVNDKVAKAGQTLKEGDTLEIRFGEKRARYLVLSLDERTARGDAASLYQVLE